MTVATGSKTVLILGAGAIGVCVALSLRQRGFEVCLVDRHLPASETSGGNAGILSDSSAVPLNNPSLRRRLPALMFGQSAGLRWHLPYLIAHLPWLMRFLAQANTAATKKRSLSLWRLISRSKTLHWEWTQTPGGEGLLRSGGWIKGYRSEHSFRQAATERAFWDALGIRYERLQRERLTDLSPLMRQIFAAAVYLPDSFTTIDPQRLIRFYADRFHAAGGEFRQAKITALSAGGGGWTARLDDNGSVSAARVIIALGPWSRDFLTPLGLRLPIVYECGSHRHFTFAADETPFVAFHDVDTGYNAVMQTRGLRLTSGVYLADLNRKPPPAILADAERHLRQAVEQVGEAIGADWFGARPSTPDGLPLLGETKAPGLWLATGHQHIGLMTSAASGELIAELINGETPTIPAANFTPARFGL